MKRLLLFIVCSICAISFAHSQSVKTKTLNVEVGVYHASLTYPYYEDENGNYMKHGVAKISSNDTYRDDDGTRNYKMSGFATFTKGQLDGAFSIKFTISGHVWNSARGIWTDGSRSLSIKGAFKNGLPDGHWIGEGIYNGFGGYKQDYPDKMDVVYKDGHIAGAFDYVYSNSFGFLLKGKGQTDKDGYYTDKSTLWGCGDETEITCKNKWLVQELTRGTNGEVKDRYDFGEVRLKALDSIVLGCQTEQQILEEYGFFGADIRYNICSGACPEGFFRNMFATEFEELTGLSIMDIQFDRVKYRFLADVGWTVLNSAIVDSLVNNSYITEYSSKLDTTLDEYVSLNYLDYPIMHYFNLGHRKYLVLDKSISLYDSLVTRYNEKISEKIEECELAKRREILKNLRDNISSSINEGTFKRYVPDSIRTHCEKVINSKIIADTLLEKVPIVIVEFECYLGANKACKLYRGYIKQRYSMDSCALFEAKVTKDIRVLVQKAKENEATMVQWKQIKDYKDIMALYSEKSEKYNLAPDYSTLQAQNEYLPTITAVVEEQDGFIRFLKLRDTIAVNHVQISNNSKPYKNIAKAYSSLYKSFILSYNTSVADETRLQEYIHLQEKFISLLSKDASNINTEMKGIKEPQVVRNYIEKL